MSKSAFPTPVRIANGTSTPLARIRLQSTPNFPYDERWLQKALSSAIDFTKTATTGETAFRVSSIYSDGQEAVGNTFGFAGVFE